MRKIFISLLAVMVVVTMTVLAFKRSKPIGKKDTQVLRLSLLTDPISLDPRKNTDNITSQVCLFIYEGLTRLCPKGVELALAEDVKISNNFQTYIFTLRKSCFSDGTPITSYDFARSWKKVLDPSFAAYNPDYFFCIKNAKQAYEGNCSFEEIGIFCKDDLTLQVELEYPSQYFLELVANKSFFPVPMIYDQSTSSKLKHYPCSGPFILKKWLRQNKMILKKNPLYWDELSVAINQIELQVIGDEMTQLSLFEKDLLDWAGSPLSMLPQESIRRLSESHQIESFPSASLYFCSFNTQRFPFTNENLRKALTFAIDRKELIEHVTQGMEVPALALLPPSTHGLHTTYFRDGDTNEAKERFDAALKELSLTKASFPTLTLSYPNIQMRHVLAQAIQQQWQKALGIKVLLESKEWQVFLTDMNARNYQMGVMGRGTHHLDPLYFLSFFRDKTKRINRCAWEDPLFKKALFDATYATTPKQKESLLFQAEKIFMNQMPIAPIFFPTNFYIKNPKLKGVFLSEVGSVDFKWSYFDS